MSTCRPSERETQGAIDFDAALEGYAWRLRRARSAVARRRSGDRLIAVRHAGIMAWLRSDAIRSQPGGICSRGRVIVCIIGRAP
jgi:hypothetical protein